MTKILYSLMAPRFLLDGMLGSLARWLRILGYDTLYHVDMEDDMLRAETQDSHRILVTRDAELHRKAVKTGLKSVIIHSEHIMEQLKELVDAQSISLVPMNTRCPRCNGDLEPVDKDDITGKVPLESYEVFDEYWICSECNAIYWKGSHWVQIEETLSKIADSKSL
jgi:uncharacterized protein with PIN domain